MRESFEKLKVQKSQHNCWLFKGLTKKKYIYKITFSF